MPVQEGCHIIILHMDSYQSPDIVKIMEELLENISIDTSAVEYCAIAAVCAWLVHDWC